MTVGKEKEQGRKLAHEGSVDSGGGLETGVVGTGHTQPHLGIYLLPRLFRNEEEEANHKVQRNAHPELRKQPEGQFHHISRQGSRTAAGGEHHQRAEQGQTRPDDVRDAVAGKERIGEEKAHHPCLDIEKQRQGIPVNHSLRPIPVCGSLTSSVQTSAWQIPPASAASSRRR